MRVSAELHQTLIVFHGDRRAVLDRIVKPRAPARCCHDLFLEQELRLLGCRRPPDGDMRIDLVELAERAVDIERVEILWIDAVGHQGRLEIVGRAVAHGARREIFSTSQKSAQLFIPPSGKGVLVIREDDRIDRVREGIIPQGIRSDRRSQDRCLPEDPCVRPAARHWGRGWQGPR